MWDLRLNKAKTSYEVLIVIPDSFVLKKKMICFLRWALRCMPLVPALGRGRRISELRPASNYSTELVPGQTGLQEKSGLENTINMCLSNDT